MGNEGVASTGIEYEVGYFGYERGTLTDVKAWDLQQVVCSGYQGSTTNLFNENGNQFSDFVTKKAFSYLKQGSVTDTAYWSENEQARSFTDTKVIIAMARPSISNTVVFKAGAENKAKIALAQKSATEG